MISAHLLISGFVQGVGFRQFVKSEARKLGLQGWVKNLVDGRVEAVTQGEKEPIENLIERCWEGPFLAEVKELTISWEESTKSYDDFIIVKE